MARVKYLRHLADDLGLSEWTITLKHEPPDGEDTDADCYVATGAHCAVIRVNPDVWSYSEEEIRRTCVHELLHAVTKRLREAYWMLQEHVSGPVFATWVSNVGHVEEIMVDSLSRCRAIQRLPLPPRGVKHVPKAAAE